MKRFRWTVIGSMIVIAVIYFLGGDMWAESQYKHNIKKAHLRERQKCIKQRAQDQFWLDYCTIQLQNCGTD